MLKKLTNLEIQDITGDIEMGLSVYIHKENHNLISIHDDYDPMMTGEEDPDFDEIQENRDDYFCIEKMGSSEGFRVMSGFAKNIKNRKTREKLFEILERRSPFRNFRAEVESDPKYRTDWFDYRSLQRTLHVREQLSEYFELEALPEAESAENEKNFNFDGLEFKLDYITPDLFIKKDTRLEFQENEDLITGEIRGKAISHGTIIAKRNEKYSGTHFPM